MRASQIKPTTVLVVEDQANIRLDLVADLTGRGFDVIDASDGDEGVRLLQQHSIDAAILDINLPGTLTGYDLAKRIRSVRPTCRVVMISGQDLSIPLDFDEHVIVESKPLDMVKLAYVLNLPHASRA